MARHRSGTIEIDVCDLLDELTDDQILDEVKSREIGDGLKREIRRDLEDIECALMAHRPSEALAIVDRLLHPKWRESAECLRQYQRSRTMTAP